NLQRELRNVVTRLDPTGAAIVTDHNVRPYAVKVAKATKRAGLKTSIHAIPASERSKSMTQLEDVLTFLERQQIDRGGCVIAVAVDKGLFDLLQRNGPRLVERDTAMLERVVFRCVAAKALIVAKDERDRGPRAILNYGHTAGHALEAATGFRITHGRAVAFGMRVAARIALSRELCSKRLVESQDALLEAFGLHDRPPHVE